MVSDSKKKKAAAKKASIKQTKIAKDAYTVTNNEDTDTKGMTPTQVGFGAAHGAGQLRLVPDNLPCRLDQGCARLQQPASCCILGQRCQPASSHARQVGTTCCAACPFVQPVFCAACIHVVHEVWPLLWQSF